MTLDHSCANSSTESLSRSWHERRASPAAPFDLTAPTRPRRTAHSAADVGLCQSFPHQDCADVSTISGEPCAQSAVIARWRAFSPWSAGARDAGQIELAAGDELAKASSSCVSEITLALAPRIYSFGSVKADEAVNVASAADRVAVDHLDVAEAE